MNTDRRDSHDVADAAELLARRISTVVSAAAEVLRVDSVGAMFHDTHGVLRLLGASDDLALLMESAQLDSGAGPGIETSRTGGDVAVDDLAADGRWPAWAAQLLDRGAGAVLSSPITSAGTVVGNLNSIIRSAHHWTPEQIRAQRAYARLIGVMLTTAAPQAPHGDTGRRPTG